MTSFALERSALDLLAVLGASELRRSRTSGDTRYGGSSRKRKFSDKNQNVSLQARETPYITVYEFHGFSRHTCVIYDRYNFVCTYGCAEGTFAEQ